MGRRRRRLLAVLWVLVLAALLANAGLGAYAVGPGQLAGILAAHAHLPLHLPYTAEQDAVLWSIRLPRVVLAALVGAALGASGAALQGVFRNPLVDPGVIGVSSGASAGAVLVITSGSAELGTFTVPAGAFAGGMAVAALVWAGARRSGQSAVVDLVLVGVALNLAAAAVTGIAISAANSQQLQSITFWSLGSVAGATWQVDATVTPLVLAGTAGLLVLAPRLNVLALGDREARHLGVRVDRVRFAVIGLAALATGASVAVAGVISFVGLVVPHLIRLIIGPDNRGVLPGSILGGAVLLMLADLAARTVASPVELPLGAITALIGAPYLFWLVRRRGGRHSR
jgi:iron complex transport system permease protein